MHSVRTRLVWLEVTHNRGGGTITSPGAINDISRWARHHGLAMHLDGARIWNAIVASGVSGKEWARHFDTVMVSFSKGLGAPSGSALVGPKDLIAQARRVRKLYGGAMRQVGFLAAACLYGMDRHIDRLAEDHANAKILAAAVAEVPGFTLQLPEVETNLVWFEVDPRHGSARDVAARLREKGVLVAPLGTNVVRMVTHLDVTREQCERAAAAIREPG
jgi:threonine aldolase